MSKHPVGFMSYVRFDDQHERGRLSQLCKRLAGEVRMQTGKEFHIFQDRNDIAWGQQWQQQIDEAWCYTSGGGRFAVESPTDRAWGSGRPGGPDKKG